MRNTDLQFSQKTGTSKRPHVRRKKFKRFNWDGASTSNYDTDELKSNTTSDNNRDYSDIERLKEALKVFNRDKAKAGVSPLTIYWSSFFHRRLRTCRSSQALCLKVSPRYVSYSLVADPTHTNRCFTLARNPWGIQRLLHKRYAFVPQSVSCLKYFNSTAELSLPQRGRNSPLKENGQVVPDHEHQALVIPLPPVTTTPKDLTAAQSGHLFLPNITGGQGDVWSVYPWSAPGSSENVVKVGSIVCMVSFRCVPFFAKLIICHSRTHS